MKAVVINNYGGPEVFSISTVPTPLVKPGHVVIKVKASSVNPADYKMRSSQEHAPPETFPLILHSDCAGVIESVGDGVESFNVGDSVYAFATGFAGIPGALAEFMLADARMIAKMPNNLSFEEAAVLPCTAVTCWYYLINSININKETSILIMGATGGVGHIALQLAKYRGVFVAAACGSDEKCKLATELGADAVMNYKTASPEDYMKLSPKEQGFDVVLNTPGEPSIDIAVSAAAFGGTILGIQGEFPSKTDFVFKWLTYKGRFAAHQIVTKENPSEVGSILSEISKLIESGVIKPLIDPKRFPFSDVSSAHTYAETGSPTGKIVLYQDL